MGYLTVETGCFAPHFSQTSRQGKTCEFFPALIFAKLWLIIDTTYVSRPWQCLNFLPEPQGHF